MPSPASPAPLPLLHGSELRLRRITPDDVTPLAAILSEPAVARFWGGYTEERVRAELLEAPGTVVYVLELDGRVVGSIQYHEETAPDYRHAGIDLFLTTDVHGRGLGADAVRTVARHLIHDRGHHRLVIDPASDNIAAIKCYEKVGFRRVGIMRSYERGPDGTWHDCLMLEALKDEIH